MTTHSLTQTIMVAGAFWALATLSFADVFTDTEGNRYHVFTQTGASTSEAELTFLAPDSTNAMLYRGNLVVPSNVRGGRVMRTYTVTGLTQYACIYSEELTSVRLAEGLTHIGYAALSECPSLQSLQLPSTLATLSDCACYRDVSLTEVTIPAATSRVGASAFAYCASLDSVGLAEGMRSLAARSFYYCSSLSQIRLPWTVDQIGEYAFAYCTGLQRITVEGRPVAITPDVFEGVDISNCTLVVPTDMVDAYAEADVWCDFIIVDGGYLDMEQPQAEIAQPLFRYHLEGHTLCIEVLGDAPVLLYNLRGERLHTVPSRGSMSLPEGSRIELTPGTYILRCGKESVKIAL